MQPANLGLYERLLKPEKKKELLEQEEGLLVHRANKTYQRSYASIELC